MSGGSGEATSQVRTHIDKRTYGRIKKAREAGTLNVAGIKHPESGRLSVIPPFQTLSDMPAERKKQFRPRCSARGRRLAVELDGALHVCGVLTSRRWFT